MLPRSNRLTKKSDFENAFKKGSSFDEKIFFLKLARNDLSYSRFGFVVSRKISKKAVIRNKIKRVLREIIRLELKKIKTGFDAIIIAKPDITEKTYRQIEETIERVLRKSRLLKNH